MEKIKIGSEKMRKPGKLRKKLSEKEVKGKGEIKGSESEKY